MTSKIKGKKKTKKKLETRLWFLCYPTTTSIKMIYILAFNISVSLILDARIHVLCNTKSVIVVTLFIDVTCILAFNINDG